MRHFALVAACALPFTMIRPAQSAVIFWNGGDSGNFQSAFNWSGPVPGPEDIAIFVDFFAGSLDVTVGFTGDVTTLGLDMGLLDVTLNLNNHLYNVTGSFSLIDAELTINNGTLSVAAATLNTDALMTIAEDATFLTGTTVLGSTAGSAAQVNVAGVWDSSASIILGSSGNGTLNISHDGMASTGEGGLVTTTSLVLGAATSGEGTVNIGDGGVLESNIATLGAGNGSNGTVSIGDGARWTNSGALTIGAPGAGSGAGTVTVDAGGLLRAQSVTIGNNGMVSSTGNAAVVFGSAATSFSSLSQSTQNRIAAGGLFVAGSGALMVMNGGSLDATRAFIDGFTSGESADATVTGNGSLLDLAGGTLTVGRQHDGTLSIAGGGRVESGHVIIGDLAGSSGAITVTDQSGGGVAAQLNADGNLSVGVAGSGQLTVSGGGRVSVAGDGTVGAAQGSTGRVVVTGIAPNDQASTLEIGGDLVVGYVPALPGAVATDLINAAVSISEGGIIIIGGGAGQATINASGLLDGNGTLDGHLELFGRLAPGSPTGAFTVTGDLVTHEGSILQIQYNDTPLDLAAVFPDLDPSLVDNLLASGVVAVQGAATLADGTVIQVTRVSGGAEPGDAIIVVHAEGGGIDAMMLPDLNVQGTFLLNWIPDVIEEDGESYLRLTAEVNEPELADFRDGLRGNLAAVADALVDGDLFGVLTQLDPDDPQAGLRTLLPLQHGAAAAQNFQSGRLHQQSFLREMAAIRTGVRKGNPRGGTLPRMFSDAARSTGASADALRAMTGSYEPIALGAMDELTGTWGGYLSGAGNWESVDASADDDRIGYRARTAGVQGGVHHHLRRDLLVGLSAGYLWSDLTFRTGFGEGDIDTLRVGPYVSFTPGGGDLFFDFAATYGYHTNEMERSTLLGTARSRSNATDLSVLAQAGYEFELTEHTILTPRLGASYTHLRSDGFSESGAGAANLTVDSMTTDSLQVQLGVSLAHALKYGDLTLVPEIYAGWSHELLDTDIDLRSRFASGSPAFTTRAAGTGDDAFQISAGFTALASSYISLYLRYEGEFLKDSSNHGVIGGLSIRF